MKSTKWVVLTIALTFSSSNARNVFVNTSNLNGQGEIIISEFNGIEKNHVEWLPDTFTFSNGTQFTLAHFDQFCSCLYYRFDGMLVFIDGASKVYRDSASSTDWISTLVMPSEPIEISKRSYQENSDDSIPVQLLYETGTAYNSGSGCGPNCPYPYFRAWREVYPILFVASPDGTHLKLQVYNMVTEEEYDEDAQAHYRVLRSVTIRWAVDQSGNGQFPVTIVAGVKPRPAVLSGNCKGARIVPGYISRSSAANIYTLQGRLIGRDICQTQIGCQVQMLLKRE